MAGSWQFAANQVATWESGGGETWVWWVGMPAAIAVQWRGVPVLAVMGPIQPLRIPSCKGVMSIPAVAAVAFVVQEL